MAETDAQFYAYAWEDVGSERTHIYNTYSLSGLIGFPAIRTSAVYATVAAALAAMPSGRAALKEIYLGEPFGDQYPVNYPDDETIQTYQYWVRKHDEDLAKDAGGTPTAYEGIWYDHGGDQLGLRCASYYGELEALGAPIDFIMCDSEDALMAYTMTEAHLLAIQNDPRAAVTDGLFDKLGWSDLTSILGLDQTTLKMNQMQRELYRAYWTELHDHGYGEIATLYPSVKFANWFGGLVEEEYISAGKNRLRPMVVGTHASPATYGTYTDATDAWSALINDVNLAKSHYLSDPDTLLAPWIPTKYAYNASHLENTPYWDELIYHLALNGTDLFQFFNPSGNEVTWGTTEERELSADVLDTILAELNTLGIVKGSVVWSHQDTGNIIASAAETATGTIWRVSTSDTNGNVTITSPVVATIPAGEVGTWVTVSASTNPVTGDVTMSANTITGDVTLSANTITGDITISANTITGDISIPANAVTGDVSIPANTVTGNVDIS